MLGIYITFVPKTKTAIKDHNVICVDCLGTKEKSYLL